MKIKNQVISVLSIAFLLLSCAKIYYSPDSRQLASTHKIFAIIPPKVSIAARKKVNPEAMKEQQNTESINFQQEMFSWMLKRKSQGKLIQEIQDFSTTNAILNRIDYEIGSFTTEQLCDSLGVDAILESNYNLTKPISDGGAVAIAVLTGSNVATNQVTVNLFLKDCSEKKLIWSYNNKYSAGAGSTPSSLVDALMRHASKKMPYMQK